MDLQKDIMNITRNNNIKNFNLKENSKLTSKYKNYDDFIKNFTKIEDYDNNFLKIKFLVNSKFIEDANLSNYYEVLKKSENKFFNTILIFNIGTLSTVYKMENYLKNISKLQNCGFFVTFNDNLFETFDNEIENYITFINNIFKDNLTILKVKNKGFDIGSFYLTQDYLIKEDIKYNFFIKLHTKTNDGWRHELCDPLFSNLESLENILENMNEIYLYGAKKWELMLDIGNILTIDEILKNTSDIYNALPQPYFIGGTIFIARKEVVDKLLEVVPLKNYILFENKYDKNVGTNNNSLVHSIERLFGISEYLILKNKIPDKEIYQYYKTKYNEKIRNKTFIYLHVCMINNWEEITNQILNQINTSGLIDKIENLFFFVLGELNKNNLEKIKKIQELNPKYKVKSLRKEIKTYEKITLNSLLDDCKNKYENCKILYLHTKGITRVGNKNVEDWVKYLIYFNVNKHNDCINALDQYDTCGVNLHEKPSLHYSGNFFWANSEYIKKLEELDIREHFICQEDYVKYYLASEMWVCSKTKKCISLHNSNINHYHQSYKLEDYKDKINLNFI
jgi:hypothetical protein